MRRYRLGLRAIECDQEKLRAAEEHRHQHRADTNDCLEQAVDQHRARDPVREPRRDRGSDRKACHIRGEYRRYRDMRGPEDDAEFLEPRCLVQQRRKSGQQEAGTDGEQDQSITAGGRI